MQQFRTHPFKARPMIALHSGSSKGINKVSKRRLTTPQPFKLSTDERATHTRPLEGSPGKVEMELQECKKQFKATPLPDFTKKPSPPRELVKRPVTTPEPFHFAVDLKSKHPSDKKKKPSTYRFKAKPLPKSTFSPSPTRTSPTSSSRAGTTKPLAPNLSVNARAEKRRAAHDEFERHAERVQREKAEKMQNAKREKAEKMMFRSDISPPVQPEPFNLQTDKRHEMHQKELDRRLKEEEEEMQRQKFHAREYQEPPPPMKIRKSSKSPTSPQPFHFHQKKSQSEEEDVNERFFEPSEPGEIFATT